MIRRIAERRLVARCRAARRQAMQHADTGLLYVAMLARLEREGFTLSVADHQVVLRELGHDPRLISAKRKRLAERAAIVLLYVWTVTGWVWALAAAAHKGLLNFAQ